MDKVQSLDKKWKELLFAASGFGPNFLMVLMGAFYTDAFNPVALGTSDSFQAVMSGTCFVIPLLFSVLYALGKIFDGIIDIPFAQITDSINNKFGRRRTPIAICTLPMMLSYAMCWVPIGGVEGKLLNTIWFFIWALVFFATYTMCLICFYGSLSTTCINESQRLRVSSYKSFFDTVNYCIVYALVPLLLETFKIRINRFVFICLPIMLTITVPLFLIKEGEKYGYPEGPGLDRKKVPLLKSLKLTFSNKVYTSWLVVECLTMIGLQLFLVSMNALIIGGMGFNGTQMAIANTAAFAPVPMMLYLFNKLKQKKGTRFTYQTCLFAFGIGILSFFFASTFVLGTDKVKAQMIISIAGGLIASWAIGSFFMLPYLAASSVSTVERKLTGVNHSAMYFAAEALSTSVVGAFSSVLIYENIKMLFIGKGVKGVVYAGNLNEASVLLGSSLENTFNLGTILVPFLVLFSCILGIIAARKLPKDFSEICVAKEFKKYNPELDITAIENEANHDDNSDFLFVQIVLTIITGFVFGFVWTFLLLKAAFRKFAKKNGILTSVFCCIIPFYSIFVITKLYRQLNGKSEKSVLALILSCVVFPILPVNLIALSMIQYEMNKV